MITLSVLLPLFTVCVPLGLEGDPPLVLRDVRVVAMNGDPVQPGRTVVVREGRIEAVGPVAETAVPQGARVIEGAGRWLIPGLCDMHTHVQDEDDLLLFVLHGVTTIFNMHGPATVLEFREAVRTGEIVGPRIRAGLYVDGGGPEYGTTTAEGGRRRVGQALEEGWDFIKAYNSIPSVAFEAMMEEAQARGIPVVGHAVREPGLEGCLTAGMIAVAHAEEYLYAFFGNPPEPERIVEAVALTWETEAAVVATLSTYHVIAQQWGAERTASYRRTALARPEARYLRPSLRAGWRAASTYADRGGSLDESLAFQRKLVRALHEGGVPLLAGSDSPGDGIIGTFPGDLLHTDLEEFVACGLTPFEALATATSNAGEFLARHFDVDPLIGRVVPGAAADLVLLSADPTADVANTRRIDGVVLGGRWLPREWMDARLEELAARNAPTEAEEAEAR